MPREDSPFSMQLGLGVVHMIESMTLVLEVRHVMCNPFSGNPRLPLAAMC